MILDIKNREQTQSAQFVLTLNFFSNKDIKQLAEKAGAALHRTIEIGATKDAWKPITEDSARLTNLYNKGFKMKRLTVGPVYYYEGINVLIKSLKFIQENGYTNELCNARIDLGFSKMNEGSSIEQLNKFKFLLNFNEDKAFELWPQNTKSSKLYKNSPKLVYPKNKFVAESTYPSGTPASLMEFSFPDAKKFGIGFDRLPEGYISIKYIGGKDYEKKINEAVEILNLVTETVFDTLKANQTYSDTEKGKISQILTEQREHLVSLKTYEAFSQNYPLIKLSFDLNANRDILNAKFSTIKEGIFDLITYGGLVRGKVNYNSDSGQIEVYEGRIKNGFNLKNFAFIESNIQAELTDCTLLNCNIRSSNLTECEIINKNDIRYSNLTDCNFSQSGDNTIIQSTIKGQPGMQVAANLTECLVIGSPLAYTATKDSKTELAI
jgi:hypothetical protein